MQEIPREKLIPGKEYYLQCFCPGCAPPNKPYIMIAKFEKLENPSSTHTNPNFKWVCVTNFRKLEEINKPSCGRSLQLDCRWWFYEISTSEVQKNMENRTYNQVLLHLIQDEYFTPGDVI
jgi:hypothetical protein